MKRSKVEGGRFKIGGDERGFPTAHVAVVNAQMKAERAIDDIRIGVFDGSEKLYVVERIGDVVITRANGVGEFHGS